MHCCSEKESVYPFPTNIILKVLLVLHQDCSDHDCRSSEGKVLHTTLTSCCLVCRQWHKAVKSIRNGEDTQAYYKKPLVNPSPSLQRTPSLPQDDVQPTQQSDPKWLPKNYATALVTSRPKFLPELITNMIPGLYRQNRWKNRWESEDRTVTQDTLAACSLVSHEWNRIITPILYSDIFLGGNRPLLIRSLLHRTLWHTKPAHRSLVKAMTIVPAKDGSTANLLSICFGMPNLLKLMLDFKRLDPATLHPNLQQHLHSLSKRCTVLMRRGYEDSVRINWESLQSCISFIRHSKSTPCKLHTNDLAGSVFFSSTCFYVGKQETSAFGDVNSSHIKQFEQHLTQTGNNLKGLYLCLYKISSLPEINLRKHPQLRLLRLNLRLEKEGIRTSQDDVIGWFGSICKSVTSKSLVIGVDGLSDEPEICNRIQNTLFDVAARVETCSIYLSREDRRGNQIVGRKDMQKLFPRLYALGIVVEKNLWHDEDERRRLAFRL